MGGFALGRTCTKHHGFVIPTRQCAKHTSIPTRQQKYISATSLFIKQYKIHTLHHAHLHFNTLHTHNSSPVHHLLHSNTLHLFHHSFVFNHLFHTFPATYSPNIHDIHISQTNTTYSSHTFMLFTFIYMMYNNQCMMYTMQIEHSSVLCVEWYMMQ